MKKHIYLSIILLVSAFASIRANVNDTTWVQAFHGDYTGYGPFDTTIVFPDSSLTYRKIYMIITIGQYNCPGGTEYCHQWDYDVENYIMTPRGDTLELGRFITPYATTGTPGFGPTWQQPYIFDVSDFYQILQDTATFQSFYSGFSYGFTCNVKFAFIEGINERNVLGHVKLWNGTYTYGDTASPIDSNLLPYSLTPPAGTLSTEMKFLITGHGSDGATGCCEFDNTGIGHAYTIWTNNNIEAQFNMNINCGWSEIYPQGGTWLYQRAGNWCPGGLVNEAQYPLTGVTGGSPFSTLVSFDDSYNGGSSFGIYKIATALFYYAGYNKNLDASLEDVIAPTNFAWYRRENPRVSQPVIKVRNTGATTITSILLQYGVKDSALAQYIWTGSLTPSTDAVISLPAISELTNLSLNSASGNHSFIAQIAQVNGQTDDDQSNDTITSFFTVAPKWPNKLIIELTTSSIGADGNLGDNPADASWQITDANNNVVASRTNSDVVTTYNDTVVLHSSNFYALTVNTSQCYGLNWWALAQQVGYTPGAVYVKNFSTHALLPLNGTVNTGTFRDDFGCGFTQYFTTQGLCAEINPVITRSGDSLITSAATSYQWYQNGDAITGATGQVYNMNGITGNYTVVVTDSGGCTGTSTSFPFFSTGIKALADLAVSVSIFPNPTKNIFNLKVNAPLTGTQYTLYDMTGRKITTGKIESELTSVAVSNISAGVYFVLIDDGVSRVVKRVVVER